MFVAGLTALHKMMIYYIMSRELHPFVHVIHHDAMQSLIPFYSSSPLVLAGSSLARLELVKVPAADGKVALVLVHAAPEVGDVLCANARGLVLGVHGGLAVLGLGNRLVGRRSGCAGTTAEPTANGVTDGGTDCDTAMEGNMLALGFQYERFQSVATYAAVLAIWPKRPLPPLAAGAACWGAAGGGACWFAGGWATVLAWRA